MKLSLMLALFYLPYIVWRSSESQATLQPGSKFRYLDNPSISNHYSRLPDSGLYKKKLLHMVHYKPTSSWPVITEYPLEGAIFPFNRIVAFYGNLYSTGMGILGALPEKEMLACLQKETDNWRAADTLIPAIPALHYIAVTAQRKPGISGKYRLRMPFNQIDRVLEMAKTIDALVFLDIQAGHSSLKEEVFARIYQAGGFRFRNIAGAIRSAEWFSYHQV